MRTPIKLGIASCLVVGATAYMAYVGMSTNWKYYLTVDECLEADAELLNQRIRVNGKVATGSLEFADDRLRATFKLCGDRSKLAVNCVGPLPDNLREDIDVVVEGYLDESGCLHGDKVLTRCASKYSTEPVAAADAHAPTSTEGYGR